MKMPTYLWLLLLLSGCGAQTAEAPAPEAVQAAASKPSNLVTLTPEMKQRANIQTVTATLAPLIAQASYSAVIQPSETSVGSVSPLIGGVITEMLADIGDQVHKGQPVARLNTTELSQYQGQLLSAQAQLSAAHAQVRLAQSRRNLVQETLKRETYLVEKGISARQDQQTAQGNLALAEVEIANAEAAQAQAQAQVQAVKSQLKALGAQGIVSPVLTLTSPISGVVVTRDIQPGQVVATGDKLFTIANLSEVWVVLQVPQDQASTLPDGTPISFTTASVPGQLFRGRITGRAQDFDPQTRNIGIRATVKVPNQALKPGLAVVVNTETKSPIVLRIPASALQQVEQKDVVFVAQGGSYQMRPVTVGAKTAAQVAITRGLQAGDSVVTEGSFILKGQVLKASLGGE